MSKWTANVTILTYPEVAEVAKGQTDMEVTPLSVFILTTTGILAGAINTLAGGGSNLTLPALMVMGMPPDVANASNRVGIFLQSLTGVLGFKHHNRLPDNEVAPMLLPTLSGGLLGALAASYAPVWLLKPLLLGAMLTMTLIMVIRPSVMAPPPGTVARKVRNTPGAWISLTIAGFYGGFVQAGVGFILLAALVGTLRYDLVRANALKLACSLAFTAIALVVFIARGQVAWIPALILSAGYIIGAHLAVRFAIVARPQTLKRLLLVMTVCGCAAALVF